MQFLRTFLLTTLIIGITACGGGGGGAPNLVGVVTTLAGDGTPGFSNGIGTVAQFALPEGITSNGTSLYVADTGNNRIRQINIATRAVTTLAGNSTPAFLDGIGDAARFTLPRGIASDGINVYVADTGNNRIRQINIATGAVTTLAGDGTEAFFDGIGMAARFALPRGITSDGTALYVADTGNYRIRKIQLP